MPTSLHDDAVRDVFERLRVANVTFMRRQPGESGKRQPVHTVYGGAHLFKADTASRLGSLALRSFEEYAPTPADLARAIGLREDFAATIHSRVDEKLRREPVEDFRVDFEDGYGNRPDAEEDGHAETGAREVAAGLAAGSLPAFIGIRIKPFIEELRDRSFRTLDLFLTTLVRETGGRLPENFVVTLPKVTIPEQVAALADLFDRLEPALGLEIGSLRLEIMIETPQSILNERGQSNLPLLASAARGRCVAAHFGTYDYTASCNITAEHQSMTHPACDFAKHMMQVRLRGHGALALRRRHERPPRAAASGSPAHGGADEENRAVVHRAWSLHAGARPPLSRRRLLPGLGPPSRAARHPLRRPLLLLPGEPRSRLGPPPQLRPEGRPGHPRGRRLRRCRHGPGSPQLLPARHQLRRHRGGGGPGAVRADAGGAAGAVVRERS